MLVDPREGKRNLQDTILETFMLSHRTTKEVQQIKNILLDLTDEQEYINRKLNGILLILGALTLWIIFIMIIILW